MSQPFRIAVLSDIHFACAAEQARGDDYEYRDLTNPFLRWFVKYYRHFIWLRHPMRQNHLLDRFIEMAGTPDLVVANGDFTCDTAGVGVSDDAAFQSVRDCLGKLRGKYGANFRATIGDHELGKVSFAGNRGGMRIASWQRARTELGLEPFWRLEVGEHVLMGITSSLVALPVFEPDTLPGEREEWHRLREQHLKEIREAFAGLKQGQRVILFCHDPTALPFLWREEAVRAKLGQVERTIIGHLHTNLILWKSRLLAGMPQIKFLGHTGKRLSTALSEARYWKPFHVKLCPALAGIQLLNDGGYLAMELDADGKDSTVQTHRIRRK